VPPPLARSSCGRAAGEEKKKKRSLRRHPSAGPRVADCGKKPQQPQREWPGRKSFSPCSRIAHLHPHPRRTVFSSERFFNCTSEPEPPGMLANCFWAEFSRARVIVARPYPVFIASRCGRNQKCRSTRPGGEGSPGPQSVPPKAFGHRVGGYRHEWMGCGAGLFGSPSTK